MQWLDLDPQHWWAWSVGALGMAMWSHPGLAPALAALAAMWGLMGDPRWVHGLPPPGLMLVLALKLAMVGCLVLAYQDYRAWGWLEGPWSHWGSLAGCVVLCLAMAGLASLTLTVLVARVLLELVMTLSVPLGLRGTLERRVLAWTERTAVRHARD